MIAEPGSTPFSEGFDVVRNMLFRYLPRPWQRNSVTFGSLTIIVSLTVHYNTVIPLGAALIAYPLVWRLARRAYFHFVERPRLGLALLEYASDRVVVRQALLDANDRVYGILVEEQAVRDKFEARRPYRIVAIRPRGRAIQKKIVAEEQGFDLPLLLGEHEDWSNVAGGKRWGGRAIAYWLVPSAGSGVRSCTVNFSTLDDPMVIQSYRVTTPLEVGRPAPTLELITEPALGESFANLAFRLLKETAFSDGIRPALHRHAQEWRRTFGSDPRIVMLSDSWHPIADLDQTSTRKGCEFNGRSLEAFFKGPVVEIDRENERYRVVFVPRHQYVAIRDMKIVGRSVLLMSAEAIYSYDGATIRFIFAPPTDSYELNIDDGKVSVTYTDPASGLTGTHSASFQDIS